MPYQKRESDENVLIAEGAAVTGDVTLGRGVNIWYYAVLRGDWGPIEVGENTNIQDHCLLHEETRIGRGCTVGHGAILHSCTIGDETLVGMGAIILNGAVIGSHCIVGAGALVTQHTVIPDGALVYGSPARVKGRLDESAIEDIRQNAEDYRQEAAALFPKHGDQ